jgi:RNA polymerase sigma-70 factor (ECF subfamily)
MDRLCTKVNNVFDTMMESSASIRGDPTLLRAAQLGSADAFHRLARGYDDPVLRLALRITGSEKDARSIYRETFLTLHGKLRSITSESSICLHIYRIATNLCLDYLRRIEATKPNVHVVALLPHERMVLELKHYQGLKLRTVSEVLYTTEETAKQILFRATHKLHCFEA